MKVGENDMPSKQPWRIFSGSGQPHEGIQQLPERPPWRPGVSLAELDGYPLATDMPSDAEKLKGARFKAGPELVDLVNAAMYLRRPLLVTGKPGLGKSTLAYAIAYELSLGPVLKWSINSRSALKEGLYRYDAIGRLQDTRLEGETSSDVARYLALGPLGSALLPWRLPRVLLIDELDKADIDLPNDLLEVLEDGTFEIPELARDGGRSIHSLRVHNGEQVRDVQNGRVSVAAFPIVIITNNGEREFPPAFLRRCLRYHLPEPDAVMLEKIVVAHLGEEALEVSGSLINAFVQRRDAETLATDQLLNAIHLVMAAGGEAEKERLIDVVLQSLDATEL